jgi:hypothetical protein
MNRSRRVFCRLLPALLGSLLLASAAGAGVQVRVEPQDARVPSLPFLVESSTQHFDFHNGSSKHRDTGLAPAATWRSLRTGLRSPLIFLGVSATAFHPEYMSVSVRSHSWIGTLVGFRLPVMRPVAWRNAMPEGELPPIGPGPTRARIADHVRVIEEYYLPPLDKAGIDLVGAPIENLRALVDGAMVGAPADDVHAAKARPNLERLERFLEQPRAARMLVAKYLAQTRVQD